MFGFSPGRQPANRQIRARTINRAIAAGDRADRLAAGPGLAMQRGPGGAPTLRTLPPEVALIARSPAGGIPAMSGSTPGSATVTVHSFDGTTLTSTTRTETAYNTTASAVGGSKYIQIKKIQGYWFVDVESC